MRSNFMVQAQKVNLKEGAKMKILISLIGSILLGTAVVVVGLSGNFSVAKPENGNIPGASDTNGCGPSGNQPKKCASVPESSSVILLGAGLAGLGFWTWRRASRKV